VSAAAEDMHLAMARHRVACTEVVLDRAARSGQGHEQQARLLGTATRGIDQLVDRLRLSVHGDPQPLNLLGALRTLVGEHERLELELAMIGLEPSEGLAPQGVEPN
jgi:hypothetical protein